MISEAESSSLAISNRTDQAGERKGHRSEGGNEEKLNAPRPEIKFAEALSREGVNRGRMLNFNSPRWDYPRR